MSALRMASFPTPNQTSSPSKQLSLKCWLMSRTVLVGGPGSVCSIFGCRLGIKSPVPISTAKLQGNLGDLFLHSKETPGSGNTSFNLQHPTIKVLFPDLELHLLRRRKFSPQSLNCCQEAMLNQHSGPGVSGKETLFC